AVGLEGANDAHPEIAGRELGAESDTFELPVGRPADDRFVRAELEHPSVDDLYLLADLECFGSDAPERHIGRSTGAPLVEIDEHEQLRRRHRPILDAQKSR